VKVAIESKTSSVRNFIT